MRPPQSHRSQPAQLFYERHTLFLFYAKQENSAATSEVVAEVMTDDPPAIAIVRCGLEQAPASGA